MKRVVSLFALLVCLATPAAMVLGQPARYRNPLSPVEAEMLAKRAVLDPSITVSATYAAGGTAICGDGKFVLPAGYTLTEVNMYVYDSSDTLVWSGEATTNMANVPCLWGQQSGALPAGTYTVWSDLVFSHNGKGAEVGSGYALVVLGN
jgi:hypothetical protein